MALDLQGGLSFTVDGPGGSTSGSVAGDGAVLRVRADDPAAAVEGLLGAVTPGPVLRGVADLLAQEGLSVEVSGPRGRVATVGAGADSGLGRLLTGSRRVQLGSVSAVRPIALAEVRRRVGPRRLALAGALAVGVVLLRRTRA